MHKSQWRLIGCLAKVNRIARRKLANKLAQKLATSTYSNETKIYTSNHIKELHANLKFNAKIHCNFDDNNNSGKIRSRQVQLCCRFLKNETSRTFGKQMMQLRPFSCTNFSLIRWKLHVSKSNIILE